MKKIININFHSRVIPIEETAYDILRKYVESLKKHFAGEEGGDEIVNDIENRFAELFSDRLKKGATCITDADVEEIIGSMGRPEDFDQDEKSSGTGGSARSAAFEEEASADTSRRLYRSENDKMLGGVCGGLAAYLRIDPSVVRIIYALLILGSFGTALLLYIILWIALPPKSLVTKIKKRLFRDPEHRVIGGVASGLAAYFNIEIWIPRVIFCLPLIVGVLGSIFRHMWFDFGGPIFITGGFGGTLFITYIILWIVVPEATTASEKLEMRGEKVDLESIKNTIKSDLDSFKQKASVVGSEMKEKAQQFGAEMHWKAGNIKKEISSINGPRQGIGHAIGVLFKAFFLFITVIITFALVVALIGVIFSGGVVLPLKEYFIHGFWDNILVWSVLLLFLVLPVVGLLTWLIRRIIGARSGSNYLGYIFGSLWVVGLISLVFLVASFSRHFSTVSSADDTIELTAPANGMLTVKMDDSKPYYIDDTDDWMGMNWRHKGPFFAFTEDSLTLNTVRIDVVKSPDSAWHLQRVRRSLGNNTAEARELASEINFPIEQKDSVLIVSRGFVITPKQQFRNQKVLLVIEMPVGKKILMKRNLEDFKWFNINKGWRNNGVSIGWDDLPDENNSWDAEVEYIMTENGLERTGKSLGNESEQPERPEAKEKPERKEAPERKENPENPEKKKDNPNRDYRYHKPKSASSAATQTPDPVNTIVNKIPESNAALVMLTSLS